MKANYKKLYGITLQQAKAEAIKTNGHLPRPGWETIIKSGFTPTHHKYQIFLANEAGSFFLWQWTSVN